MGSDPAARGRLEYCEAALPVPLDRTFTYAVPSGLRGRVRPGCRVLVAFGARTLAGVVVDAPSDEPGLDVRPVLKLLDDEPALGPDLIALGRWIASYYCAPLGEVLKAMLPLDGEMRTKRVVSLTAEGAAAADGLLAGAATTEAAVLLALRRRRLTLPYLASKHRGAGEAVRRLRQRGLVAVEESVEQRRPDPRPRRPPDGRCGNRRQGPGQARSWRTLAARVSAAGSRPARCPSACGGAPRRCFDRPQARSRGSGEPHRAAAPQNRGAAGVPACA